MGLTRPVVAHLYVAVEKDPLPGHKYVIEEDHRVHLLKAGTQGMVEVGAAQIEALPTEHFQAWRVAGDGKPKGVAPLGSGGDAMAARRIDGDFIRQGAQRGQHPSPLDHQPVILFLDHSQRHIGAVFQGGGSGRAATLEINQGVG